jgi:hypothetical protein
MKVKWFVKGLSLLIAGLAIGAATIGCNTWERNTFNTLAATKAVIDTARADYTAGKIPNNACTYAVLNDATAADKAAVDAMIVYEELKAKNGNLNDQIATVTDNLAGLAPLVAQLQALYTNPAACSKPASPVPAKSATTGSVRNLDDHNAVTVQNVTMVGYDAMPNSDGKCPQGTVMESNVTGISVCMNESRQQTAKK